MRHRPSARSTPDPADRGCHHADEVRSPRLGRLLVAALVVLALIAAACGDDDADDTAPDDSGSSTDETDETDDADDAGEDDTGDSDDSEDDTGADTDTDEGADDEAAAPAAGPTPEELAEAGPYEVGITTRTLDTGNLVEVWYPATDAADGITDAYAVRTFTGPLLEPLVPEALNDDITIEAARDIEPADDGPFPIVLFSHGFAAFRVQSSTLARHLASWGMVVASADHPTRELVSQLGAGQEDPPDSADDMRGALAIVTTPGDELLDGVADPERVALGGHSAGGGTILAVATADDGIAGYVSYASGARSQSDLPDIPSMFMAGSLDTIGPPENTYAAYERAPSPSWYWEFADSGHLAFSDLCTVGDGDGTLIDLAEEAGIGELVPPDLRSLATDGCEPPNVPVPEVRPAIFQGTTGFYRWVFGIDDEPIGLDSPVVEGVTVESH